MKTKELVELVKQGARPIIKTIEHTDDGPDKGLIGRIIGLGKSLPLGRRDSVQGFRIDFFSFTEVNEPSMVADWYDSSSNPTLKWAETPDYEKESKDFEIFESYTENGEYCDLKVIEVTEENKFLTRYLNSNPTVGYVEWLESQLENIENKN